MFPHFFFIFFLKMWGWKKEKKKYFENNEEQTRTKYVLELFYLDYKLIRIFFTHNNKLNRALHNVDI